jgi:hypothetical protein
MSMIAFAALIVVPDLPNARTAIEQRNMVSTAIYPPEKEGGLPDSPQGWQIPPISAIDSALEGQG